MPDSSMTVWQQCVLAYINVLKKLVQCHMTWCQVGTRARNTVNVYKELVSPLSLFCVLVRHGFNKFLNLSFSPAICSNSRIFGIVLCEFKCYLCCHHCRLKISLKPRILSVSVSFLVPRYLYVQSCAAAWYKINWA